MTLRETFEKELESRIDSNVSFLIESRNENYIKWLEEKLEAKMKQNLLMSKDLGGALGSINELETRIKGLNNNRIHLEIQIAEYKNNEF